MPDFDSIISETTTIINEFLERVRWKQGELFVLGMSTSEVAGGVIGRQSNPDIGRAIIGAISRALDTHGIDLAVQGCEHINRALVLERRVAERHGFEEVTVVPALHAGGGGAVSWYQMCEDPVVVEHIVAKGGIDIGDTSIGMHVRHVQIPIRLSVKTLGLAHVTCLSSRPKLIGGPRAHYTDAPDRKTNG